MTTKEELTVPVVDSDVTTEELTIDLEVTTEARETDELTVPAVDSEVTTDEELRAT